MLEISYFSLKTICQNTIYSNQGLLYSRIKIKEKAHFIVLHVRSHAICTIADAYFDIVIVISELSLMDYSIGIQILSPKKKHLFFSSLLLFLNLILSLQL